MSIDIHRIQALCFDIDGTLSDTDDQFVQRLARLLTPFRSLFPNNDVLPFSRRVVQSTEGPGNWTYEAANRVGLDHVIVAIGNVFYELGIRGSGRPFELIQGVDQMLASLKNRYPISIVSARGRRSADRFLDQFGLEDDFVTIVTGQTCRHTKPYAQPLQWAAEKMGVPAEACLMVGDTEVDVLCGKRAGAQTVGVLCGFGTRSELEHAGADVILHSTADLAGIL